MARWINRALASNCGAVHRPSGRERCATRTSERGAEAQVRARLIQRPRAGSRPELKLGPTEAGAPTYRNMCQASRKGSVVDLLGRCGASQRCVRPVTKAIGTM